MTFVIHGSGGFLKIIGGFIMKRKVSLFLVLALSLSMLLAGCGNKQTATDPKDSDNAPAEEFKFTENMTLVVPY